jgi:phospholipid/cholesterol/gamma-HCH transport system substrate-binding protein
MALLGLAAKTKIKVNLIVFVVLAIGLSYAMATQVLTILQDRYSVFAIFPDAGGVFTNQEVTYRGVTVGNVGDMEIVEEGVKLELLIEESTRIPKEDTEARVMFKSAVGEQFVDILPGGEGEPFFEDDDVIPIEQTSIPVSTQELLTTLQNVLAGVPPEDLKGAIDALGMGLTGRGPDLATIIESMAELADLFAERAPEVEGILKKGTQVGGAFLDSRRDFARAISELVTVSESLASSTGDLEALMNAGNLTSDEVVALIRENRTALNQFVIEFAEVNKLQADHKNDLAQLFIHLPTGLNRVASTFEPATGLVRFGLVNDDENHGCSYGTERRQPSNRSPKLPPKKGRCGARGSAERSAPSSTGRSQPGGEDAVSSLLGGLGPGANDSALPARMSDLSWVLFYVNGL